MSLTYTLRRLIDPDFATASEQAQMERVLEQEEAEVPGGAGLDVKLHRIVVQRSPRSCRVCGRVGEGSSFCMSCLADTMA